MSKKAYFKITKNSEAEQPYHFVLKAANHETILSSENYSSMSAALNGIDSVRENSQDKNNFDMRTSKADEPYFVLLAKNYQVIGVSEMYSSKQMCEHGISSVMKNAKDAALKDETVDEDSEAVEVNDSSKGSSTRYG